jgi:hypothetical protein
MKRTSSSEGSHNELKKSRRESSRTKVKTPEPKAVTQPSLSPGIEVTLRVHCPR